MAVLNFNRTIDFSMFQKLDSRPSGETEDAQIASFFQTKNIKLARGKYKIASFDVDIYVERSESWIVKSFVGDANLKNHEQRHYDIMAVGAREFHDEALKLEESSTTALQGALETLAEDIRSRTQEIQDRYDTQTNHGVNTSAQGRWNTTVASTKLNTSGKLADLPK